MSNETMPEKIWASGENGNGWWERNLGGKPYIREDAIPDVAELQRQNAALKTLFRKLFDEASWTVYDTIQNEAREGGVIIPHEVTQEDIDDVRFDSSECELGDTVFMMSDWMTDDAPKMPIPARAEVAREFAEAVLRRIDDELIKSQQGMIVYPNQESKARSQMQKYMRQVLAEWEAEDADKSTFAAT